MKPQKASFAFAVFLSTVGAAALVLGLHDAAIASAGVGLTAFGALLAVVGVVQLIAAYQLLRSVLQRNAADDSRSTPSAVVPIAFLLAVAVGLYLFFAAIGSGGVQRVTVMVGALTLVTVGLLGLRSFGRHLRLTRLRIEGAIALGLLGIAVGLAQFWFENQYVPAHAGQAVALKAVLSKVGEQRDYDVIRAKVDYEGIGAKSVSVIGSAYTLTGSRVVRCHRDPTPERFQEVFEGFIVDPQATRHMTDVWEERPATVLAAGKFVGDGKRLDPNVPAGRDIIFYVPRHRFQLLRFRAQLFAIPASVRLSQRAVPEFANFPGDNELYGFWKVEDDSWLRDLIYGRARWVIMRYELVDPSNKGTSEISTALRVTARFPSPTWDRSRPGAEQVSRLFAQSQPDDSSEPFANTELPLGDVGEPSERAPESCRN